MPFATWGGVTSGLALPDLAEALQAKGFQPVGAAKVLAEHASMWAAPEPLCAGCPNALDLEQVADLVARVTANLELAEPAALDLRRLDYLSPSLRSESASKSLAKVKAMMPPPKAIETRCTQCGECVAVCPVGAITLDPYPVMADSCILCQQCVRTCPSAYPDAEAGKRICRPPQRRDKVTPHRADTAPPPRSLLRPTIVRGVFPPLSVDSSEV